MTENSHHVKVGLDIFELVLVLILLFVSVSRHYPFLISILRKDAKGEPQCPQCRLTLPEVGAQPQPELPATDKLYFILISVFPNTLDFLSIFQMRIHSIFYLSLYFKYKGFSMYTSVFHDTMDCLSLNSQSQN